MATMSSAGSEHDVSNILPYDEPPRRGRGRPTRRRRRGLGSTRGRGGTRTSRAGRGKGQSREPNRAEDSLQNTQQRSEDLENKISTLTEGEVRELLHKAAMRYPSIALDLLQPAAGQPSGGYHPPPGTTPTPPWCSCSRCREMPTEAEKVCCGRHPDHCISQLADFQVLMLDEAVLAVARMYRNDILVLPDDPDYNKANRHQSYRQYIVWQHGRLGAGVRRVIPSCCIWRIRDKFPDAFGQYTGFKPARLG